MQHAYAGSKNSLRLMAETQIVMGAARQAETPEQVHAALQGMNAGEVSAAGDVVEISFGSPQSLDVLGAPRECNVHVANQSTVLSLVPAEGATIQSVVDHALGPVMGSSAMPKSDASFKPGTGHKK